MVNNNGPKFKRETEEETEAAKTNLREKKDPRSAFPMLLPGNALDLILSGGLPSSVFTIRY